MTLPTCSTYPDELGAPFWEKKKGALPERHDLFGRLKGLQKQHQAIDWKLLDSAWTQGLDSPDLLTRAFEPRQRLGKGALRDLQREIGAVRTAAKALEKGAAGPTLDAARAIAGAAEILIKAIEAALGELATQHERARAQLARDEKARARDASSGDDEDDDEPVDLLLDPQRLLQQLRRCRREPGRRMSFAFIDAKGDEPAVLAMHPRLSARRLFAKAQAAAGRKTGTFGQGWVEDQSLMLQIDKPISGLVRKVRRPIKAAGFRVARVVLAQADGSVFEEDVTDEGEDGDDGDASADGMRGAASATASAADARDPTTVDAGGDEDPDADAARWRRAADRFTPLVTAALAAGECDTARLQAIWQFARDKAASGQHDVALGALKNLVPLLTTGQPMPRSRPMSMPTSAAAAASTTTKPTGDDARADASRSPTAEPDEGQALLQELKTRFPAFRDALAILPDRTREATRLIQDIPHHVQVVDLPAARAAMARLDILVEDAARHLRARREVELRRAAIGERFLRLTGLPAGAQTQRLRLAYDDAATRLDAHVRMNAFVAALPLLHALEASLRDLEAWGSGQAVEAVEATTTDRSAGRGAASAKDAETPEAARARWERTMDVARPYIASVQDCGRVEPPLEALRQAFLSGLDRARALARAGEHARAIAQFEAARVHADRFLHELAESEDRRMRGFAALRAAGAGTAALPDLAGAALGAEPATPGIEQAMEENRELGKSRGLITLVEGSKQVDGLFATCCARPSSTAVAGTLRTIGQLMTLVAAYMTQHPSGARSGSDREKHKQGAMLDVHHRLQRQYLEALLPMLRELDAIDPAALALDHDQAARVIGRLDRLLTSNASPAVKAVIGALRLDVIGALTRAATTRDRMRRVAEVAGPDFRDAFRRQVAAGPLRVTLDASRAYERHVGSRLQKQADVENIDRARLLANRLVADDGNFDVVALRLHDPLQIGGASSASRQMAHVLTLLEESGEAQMALQSIEAPPPRSNAAWLVRATLGLPTDAPLTAAHARRAALAALLSDLRQANVGSCFATQVAIRIHDTEPATCLRDIGQMMREGRITRRPPDGTEVNARIQTEMSEVELKERTVRLTSDGHGALVGSSSGGRLTLPVALDTVPGFRRAMAAIGIAEHDGAEAMAAALGFLQRSRAFSLNQNLKAVTQGLSRIADPRQRARLTEAVMPHVTHDRDASWAALEAAMTPGDPTRRPPAGVTAIERDAVRARFDNTLRAPAFDVEPALVIDALIMCRLGLSEDDVARARACDRLRAELTAHPDIRSAKSLTRPADADLMDRLERLRIETEAVDRGAIGRLESMRRDASVVFQAEGQSPLLRAWEYTLTALAERASGDRAMQQLQEAEMKIVEQEAHDLALRFTQARDFRASGVARQDVRDIEERLMAHYRKVFAAGTSAGYDAAVRTDLSPDGQSGRGVWCLYDIQGIDDPDQWIKIEDAQAYGRLVQGMMMLAWKQAFGRERDPAIAAMSRRLADALAERLLDDEVADRLARQSEAAYPGRRATPWRLDGSGVSTEAKEVLDERTPRVFVVDAPADARDLLNRLGQHLRTLWTDPASGLKASAERHGDAATVSTSSHGTHAFSLVPGAAGFRQLLDDPRDFAVALEAHVDRERGRWKQALEDTVLRTREDVALQCQLLLGKDATSELVDAIWTAIGARPTMRAFCDSFTQLRAGPGREPPAVTRATLARHVVEQLAPPVAAAELEGRLGQVAKALAVPSDRRAAVVRTALATLTRLDPVQAGMTDIRAAMAASMREHGLDEGAATQQKVSNALRPPAGLIFADTNWGDAERRVKLALVVHPFTGEPEVWKMHDDNSQAEPAEPARYVHRPWHVRT